MRVSRTLIFMGVMGAATGGAQGAELLGFYDFEGGFTDGSTAGNDPTLVDPGVVLGAGNGGGQAAVFGVGASGTGLVIPVDINPGVRPNLTIGAWVNPTTAADNAPWGHDDGGWDRGVSAGGADGNWRVSNGNIFDTGLAASAGWQFLAVTYRGGATNTYVDGSVFTQVGAPGPATHTGLAVGSLNPGGVVHSFNGSIDNFFVYDDALTANQLAAIRAAGPGAIAQTIEAPAGARTVQQVWNFESGDLTGWSVVDTTHGDNTVFSSGGQPADLPGDNANIAATAEGGHYVRTWDGEAGGLGFSDGPTGIIESDEFVIGPEANFEFLVGGGGHQFRGDPDAPEVDMTAFTLEIEVAPGDWEAVMEASGFSPGDGNLFREGFWDAGQYEGETARLRIYDTHSGGWGHIDVDNVRYSTIPEPTVLGLLGGVFGLILILRRRK
ncbi:MAG: LamG domain-containing protein [Verrucomicrobiales bacterium]|nr:LamG domain-containing protein [Verrucomicrobiales bacterium]